MRRRAYPGGVGSGCEYLPARDAEVLAAVREFCDTRVVPVANDYWERAEFSFELLDGYRDLGVAGGALCESAAPGCPRWAKG